jgi:hypothetical protein
MSYVDVGTARKKIDIVGQYSKIGKSGLEYNICRHEFFPAIA